MKTIIRLAVFIFFVAFILHMSYEDWITILDGMLMICKTILKVFIKILK